MSSGDCPAGRIDVSILVLNISKMNTDNETRLVEEGDRIIKKKSHGNFDSLSSLEIAIYDFWLIDYAVRNSGTLEAMRELNEISILRLKEFAKNNNCPHLYSTLELAKDETSFCATYYQNFENACNELRYFNKNKK
jgi:hypothetical protein